MRKEAKDCRSFERRRGERTVLAKLHCLLLAPCSDFSSTKLHDIACQLTDLFYTVVDKLVFICKRTVMHNI
jgi:hypothetical protein